MHRHGAIVFGVPAIERALSSKTRLFERGGHHHYYHRHTSPSFCGGTRSRSSCCATGGGPTSKANTVTTTMMITKEKGTMKSNHGSMMMMQSSFFSPQRRIISTAGCGCNQSAVRNTVVATSISSSSSSSLRQCRSNANVSSAVRRRNNRQHQQQPQSWCTSTSFSTTSSAPSAINTANTGSGATSTASSFSSYSSNMLLSTLQQSLLRPRSLPLPRYLTPRHYTYTLSETFGHASFVLMAISYSTSDFLQLRLLAVLGSTSMVLFTYFHPHGRILWLPLQWNLLFIGINLYRIGKVYYYRYCASNMVSEEMKHFRQEHLSSIDPIDYYKLLQLATVEIYEEGTMVMQQGQANPYIRIVLEGELQVLRDGTLTYVLEEGMFVSEGGLHAGLMLRGSIESCCSIVVGPKFDPFISTTTTTTDTTTSAVTASSTDTKTMTTTTTSTSKMTNHGGKSDDVIGGVSNTNDARPMKQINRVRCLRWNRTELVDLLESSSNSNNSSTIVSSSGVDDDADGSGGGGLLGNALRAALSWDIVRKLKSQRHMLTEGRVKDPTSWSRKREEQGIARYASILQNILQHTSSSDTPQDGFRRMRAVLTKYRGIHRIDDESHEKALAKCGWTVEEFQLGKKNKIVLREHDEDDADEDDDDVDFVDRRGGEKSKLVRSFFQ